MEFEWDPDKARRNLLKHGVAFEDAMHVFFDPRWVETYDGRESYGEDRWAIIGASETWPMLLYVIYTVRNGSIIRLISARKANGIEQKRYREANH